ncbi:class II aldolase/adducin family protein [Nocardioides sp. SLBN-35]|uniref:class II aldolase/adducin family protein n=1 Tax=Nocardioides sp. SLBN-35 TaxID=2768445 RepID=UPI00114ECF5E|nr:class II aldolase/adducin family protein [Nocardioides sp. SLBN-35]TQK69065.1 HCOMODA/2-hydroxy-3-carboxy-muconic semialdehyde decarboxylase [Nocardioides sp. SLBN-35]
MTQDLRTQLVEANHILFDQGVLDAFGHVSVRSDERPDRFLLARNMAPVLVTAEDVQEYDLDGRTSDRAPSYLERFIHAEIYRARPDVQAVVHSHSASVIPFGLSSTPMRPLFHMAGFLADGIARFEIRDVAGDATDLLVRDADLGAELAASLGEAPFALMRGHGSVAVAPSLPLAVYRAVYAEENAALQLRSMPLGDTVQLTVGEGRAAADTNAGQVGRAWDMWRRLAAARQQGLRAG